ncbi:glycosyl transferase, group 1 [Caldicellulosiruptor saccharolyticus DSM 8903]|uniref:Glycosyl transferase, group 1 n=1 Tax=Caldicellulosiruptor saccharolyticus (strain ATCC 43494 / DSM 8903 / Tp8T 6331) TaxID=351627 RepID=A4XMK6_CALS8|nr:MULTISPECIES: glycosyltransferase [Caldicellulosiruptor]ABP68141.1 glycosyl transferase, group 1 [Caldicellulosiruptor saccharolyticus DSM 8903]
MKVAIVHEWLTTMGGSEKVILELKKLFPEAPIYTLVYNRRKLGKYFDKYLIITSNLQKNPLAHIKHQLFFKYMPRAFENFDLSDFDLVISSSSAFAKGVITSPNSVHICYCHTPPRYLWDLTHEYLKDYNLIIRRYLERNFHYLRIWDTIAANRVDYFVANSNYVANRIKKFYKRDCKVIYPPVDTEYFTPAKDKNIEDYYLIVSRLVPYKRVDLAVEAFNQLSKRLVIVGDGPEYKKLKSIAKSNIEFLGYQPDKTVRDLYQRCKALIFPGVEDFGIVPVEVQACGRPVIALKKGGAVETVEEGKTGVFFEKQDVESLKEAVYKFEQDIERFDKDYIRSHAEKFSAERFRMEFKDFILKVTEYERGEGMGGKV